MGKHQRIYAPLHRGLGEPEDLDFPPQRASAMVRQIGVAVASSMGRAQSLSLLDTEALLLIDYKPSPRVLTNCGAAARGATPDQRVHVVSAGGLISEQLR